LNVLEDFLDGWPGTLVVVSHDRYFLERVCDTVWALLGDGTIRMLPRGVEEYLERRRAMIAAEDAALAAHSSAAAQSTDRPAGSPAVTQVASAAQVSQVSQAEQREARKTIARLDRQLAKLADREEKLHAQLVEHASDYEKLAELDAQLQEVLAEKEALEEEWLEAASLLE
ncbi:MAG TPA: ABC transporter ATP-binding protein, partial [Nocardioidaceae bacterium]|nr:ABC transporter ATP-binding protein [Nocardioidaceae bacterium]